MDACYEILLRELRYGKIERIIEAQNSDPDLLRRLFELCTTGEYSIIVLPHILFEISPFQTKLQAIAGGGPYGSDNAILAYPVVSEAYFRQVFTGIELIIFKLTHIIVHCQANDYNFENERSKTRLNRLKSALPVSDWVAYKQLFDNIMFVRDAFAHSFIDIKDIAYKGIPLKACFGRSSVGGRVELEQATNVCFMEDLIELSRPLFELFASVQFEQFDKKKLFRLCDHAIKERTLRP